MAILKACVCGARALPGTTRCGKHPRRWKGGSTHAWRQQRARILARDNYRCTEPWCDEPATEVHHLFEGPSLNVPDDELASVCYAHNPRGG